MISVSIKSDVDKGLAKARSIVRALPRRAETILRAAVVRDREGHKYQNRTHNAQNSTRVLVLEDNGEGDITLRAEMGVEYASFLQRNGLSKWEKFVERAKASMTTAAEKVNATRL